MYEKLTQDRTLGKGNPPIHFYFEAIRQMYRKKHPRLVQYMDMLKDNDIVDIHTATEEQISKIGKSKVTTPMSMNYFTPFIAEDLDEIVKEFKYRMGKENLIKFKSDGQKEFVGENRFV